MNERLQELIRYKTGGRQTEFAVLLGWSPQYLAKLLKGEAFGLRPVMAVGRAFPEVNLRWWLFGEGAMLNDVAVDSLRSEATGRAFRLLDLGRFVPVMSAEELRVFERSLSGVGDGFDVDTIDSLQKRLYEKNASIAARFSDAVQNSDELCKTKKAKGL